MLLASFLGIFDSAELEHTAWILFWRNGPPTGTVAQEPLKSDPRDSGGGAWFISSIERNFCTGISPLVSQAKAFT